MERGEEMRVIAGEFKSRSLKAVPGNLTRPTSDKVKESLFQMIGPFFSAGHALDLFAGSGNLGIEAISRGIEHVTFVEKNPKAIRTIHENIALVKVADQTTVYRMDAFRALQLFAKEKMKYDLIFVDPPYEKISYQKILEQIVTLDLLADSGKIICEHDPSNNFSHEALHITKQVKYSNTIAVTIFKK